MTTLADAMLAITKEQRNRAIDDNVALQARLMELAGRLAERDEECAKLRQRVTELETARETPPPKPGSKAHLNEVHWDSVKRIQSMCNGTFNGN